MPSQIHRIKRLVFEMNIEQHKQAKRLQAEISRICKSQIQALLERCLGEAGTNRLQRIDSLELDLGYIDPVHLEQDMLARLEQTIRCELSVRLAAPDHDAGDNGGSHRTRSNSQQQSGLELVDIYARKGRLPWWAEQGQTDPLGESLNDLLHESPVALAQLMRRLIKDPRALTRIIKHSDDDLLSKLSGLLCVVQATSIDQLTGAMISLLSRHIDQARPRLWLALLQTAGSASQGSNNTSGNPAFWRAVLQQLALAADSRYDRLLSNLHQGLNKQRSNKQRSNRQSGMLHKLVNALFDELPVTDSGSTSAANVMAAELDWESVLRQLKTRKKRVDQQNSDAEASLGYLTGALVDARIRPPPDLRDRLGEFESELRALLSSSRAVEFDALFRTTQSDSAAAADTTLGWHTVLRQLEKRKVKDDQQDTDPEASLGYLIGALVDAGSRPAPNLLHRLSKFAPELRAQLDPSRLTALDELYRVEHPESLVTPVTSGKVFSDTDQAYVDNAGLVLLWPFLQRFFDQLNLLSDQGFIDDAARQRAVGLLQYLVAEDPSGPEYRLPLNKVLSGMDPDEVFDFGPPLNQDERAQCSDLLDAVIGHVSILRQMSVAGFRGSFLLRKGLLESRDGAWLLRVEQESYDIVLERFPWTFSWIKLPWMGAALRVEW